MATKVKVRTVDENLEKVLEILQAEIDFLKKRPPEDDGLDTLNRATKVGALLFEFKKREEVDLDSILALKTNELESLNETISKELTRRGQE